jgi:hypothetical protein
MIITSSSDLIATAGLKRFPSPLLKIVVVDLSAQRLLINRGIPFARASYAAATKVSIWTDGSIRQCATA